MVLQTKMPADNERFAERGALPTRKILCGKEVCRPHESLLEAALRQAASTLYITT